MAESANFGDLRSESTPMSTRPIIYDANGLSLDATIVLFVVTSLVTSYRCFSRYKKGLWWHDDSVALFSTIFFTFFLVGSCTHFRFAARQMLGLTISLLRL